MKKLYKQHGQGSTGVYLMHIDGRIRLQVQNKDIIGQVMLTPDEAKMIADELRDMGNAIKGAGIKPGYDINVKMEMDFDYYVDPNGGSQIVKVICND